MFIDREVELASLEDEYEAHAAGLFVLQGRRRVGKTALLRRFCEDKPQLFFVATLASSEVQLARFSAQLLEQLGLPSTGASFPTWDEAFARLASLPGRPVVVLDEFTYLMDGDPAIPSILQRAWDETLKDSLVFLVLCGSQVGMMEREVLGYASPLYGRRTGSRELGPLPFPAAARFLPAYDARQAVEAWSILGGIPFYLQAFDDRQAVLENALRTIVQPHALLYNEPRLLTMEELRAPRNYFSVLQAIAHGNTRLNEIAQSARLERSLVGKYLDVLRDMRLVRREVPVTETRPEKSRRGIYRIQDPFLRFWFRFVNPFQDRLDLGLAEVVMEEEIAPRFNGFVGGAYEELALQHVAAAARAGALPIQLSRLGRWWSKDAEIDLLGIDERNAELLVGECKWTERPVGAGTLDALLEKSRLVPGGPWRRIRAILFAKHGFTDAVRDRADGEDVLLVTAEDMLSG